MSTDQVYVRHSTSGPKTVHTDPECPHLNQIRSIREVPADLVSDAWNTCKWCCGTASNGGTPGSRECPLCGEAITGDLRIHLPCEGVR